MKINDNHDIIVTNFQITKYLAFNPSKLVEYLKIDNPNPAKVASQSKEYYLKHQEEIDNIILPKGYIIGELKKADFSNKPVDLNKYDYEECEDINLLISILSLTVNDLYVSNKDKQFNKERFKNIVLLPLNEVKNGWSRY